MHNASRDADQRRVVVESEVLEGGEAADLLRDHTQLVMVEKEVVYGVNCEDFDRNRVDDPTIHHREANDIHQLAEFCWNCTGHGVTLNLEVLQVG